MRVYYCDDFVLPLPEAHRFPMEKYALLRERVAVDVDRLGAGLFVPEAATDAQLLRVHSPAYVASVASGALTPSEVRRIGFPWSRELVERSRRSIGGTLGAMHSAFDGGVGVNLAGGTHHAFPSHGEGFCVFNDVAVAVREGQARWPGRRFAVVDLDVHQGNGTAAVFGSDPDVFTVSVHGESNYPFHKTSSDLDIGLPDQCADGRFLEAVDRGVRAALEHGPDLVFYVAGADAFVGDRLGRLSVSKAAMFERDRIVLTHTAAAGVPVAVVMAGGYAVPVEDTVEIHHHSVVTALGWRSAPAEILGGSRAVLDGRPNA